MTLDGADDWFDAQAGPLVRPYTLTGGRARTTARLDLVTYVVATRATRDRNRFLTPEQRRILKEARQPTSVAEMASHLDLALGVVRVMLADLLAEGLIALSEPDIAPGHPDTATLEAVIHVLRTL
jgi:hypothetical protein